MIFNYMIVRSRAAVREWPVVKSHRVAAPHHFCTSFSGPFCVARAARA